LITGKRRSHPSPCALSWRLLSFRILKVATLIVCEKPRATKATRKKPRSHNFLESIVFLIIIYKINLKCIECYFKSKDKNRNPESPAFIFLLNHVVKSCGKFGP